VDGRPPDNLNRCNCSLEPCHHKGLCCEFIAFHFNNRELPVFCFPANAEASYDRSFELFLQLVNSGQT
jgi:hypothetical protein